MKIFVTTQFGAMHRWPDAPESVLFLRSAHRHLFKVRLEVEVTEEDRELEFFTVKKELHSIIFDYLAVEQQRRINHSCETMAMIFLEDLKAVYPNRKMICEVSEDGENGAIVEMTKEGIIC